MYWRSGLIQGKMAAECTLNRDTLAVGGAIGVFLKTRLLKDVRPENWRTRRGNHHFLVIDKVGLLQAGILGMNLYGYEDRSISIQ